MPCKNFKDEEWWCDRDGLAGQVACWPWWCKMLSATCRGRGPWSCPPPQARAAIVSQLEALRWKPSDGITRRQ
ncbi:MAG: hypothetical protein M3361_11115 [Candidatus Tectomicrobia bacterium]|nr:hypothetical protein [Candidatus Tectomicrobia bacterium]